MSSRGNQESHSHEEKVALDTKEGPEFSPRPTHPRAVLTTIMLDSIPAKDRLPSGVPLSHTET